MTEPPPDTDRSTTSHVVAASATVDLVQRLRADGAASGYPLPTRLVLDGAHLRVEWGAE